MKAIFLAAALGAVVAVNAASDDNNGDSAAVPEELSQLFESGGSSIDWSKFSPEALGMNLEFDEMSSEELQKVVSAFVKLGLISSEEAEAFGASLVDPRMRNMLQNVSENWPETMQKIFNDPDYQQFLSEFQGRIDEQALADIVGLKEGLPGAVRGLVEQENNEQ